MSDGNVCCLCLKMFEDSKCIYDEASGNPNEVHQLMLQYFDVKLLHEFSEGRYKDMCLKCWQLISDFNNYQQSVYQAQDTLLIKSENIPLNVQSAIQWDIESEDEIVPEVNLLSDDELPLEDHCNEQSNNECRKEQINAQKANEFLLEEYDCNNEQSNECREEQINVQRGNEFLLEHDYSEQLNECRDEQMNAQRDNEFLLEEYDCNEQSNNECREEPINVQTEPAVLLCDSSSLADDNSDMDDIEEYDDPIGVFTGGEFGNEGDSKELPAEDALVNAEASENSSDLRAQEIIETPDHRLSMKASDDIIAQWSPILDCVMCSEKFTTYTLLRTHFNCEHPLDKFQVECCGKYFSRRDRYEDHMRVHMDPNAFICPYCNVPLLCRSYLASHIRDCHPVSVGGAINPTDIHELISSSTGIVTDAPTEVHRSNSEENQLSRKRYLKSTDDFIAEMIPILKCDLCPTKFSRYTKIREHYSKEHPGRKCFVTCCNRKFTPRYRLLEHLRRAHLRANLENHHKTSANKDHRKPCYSKSKDTDDLLAEWLPSRECAICKMEFTSLGSLKLHFKKCNPTNEEFYIKCCQRKFNSQRDIEAHVRFHVNPTHYKCDACFLCYDHKRSLIAHIQAKHKERSAYKCGYCCCAYIHRRSLIVHMRRAHPDEQGSDSNA